MEDNHKETQPTKLEPKEAKGGVRVKGMPAVLGISLAVAAVILLALVLGYI
ncbi:MAG: hypothetical protein HKN36_04075 [Hellea sp.]|nr:hypothetical protein [Hellea sp.]